MSTVKICALAREELNSLSKKMLLSLDEKEMTAVQAHYKKLGREPMQIELETIAQTWSEHCKHKTFNSKIVYEENGKKEEITSLFRTFIKGATQKTGKKRLVSVFSDNAGIIEFNGEYNIAMKTETHNHPSALEPYGGANTGLGGVIRDILGAGLGAKPIANTDVFCFADPGFGREKLPKGVLHPKRVFKGIRAGVRDYGNRMGIPTVNGAILFDNRYLGNPLVYCGTVGLIPRGMEKKAAKPRDLIVVLGGRTGRDGIHGATFSSLELYAGSSGSAVQIGNPIEERKMMDALLRARDLGIYNSVTDCGAGGFSSAIGEMGAHTGARVHLEKAPLKYEGLLPWEIWLSEAQERMILSVPEKNLEKLMEICKTEGTEAAVIGEFTDSKKLELFYNGKLEGELPMKFLHDGVPVKTLKASWHADEKSEKILEPGDYAKTLKQLLGMPNIASKETTIRQYDHEVQGGIVGKPLVGALQDGPSDAAIVRPVLSDWRGVVLSNGINPLYSDLDPYWMACSAVDEAIRNAVCVGADFESIALLDNFSWGNPEKEAVLGSLVRACRGCHDASVGFGAPFISGKDSLYNEYSGERGTISIPGTLLISAVGIIPDSRKKVSMPLKKEGNLLYIVGETFHELGGSHYAKLNSTEGKSVPKVDFEKAKKAFSKLSKIMQEQSAGDKIIAGAHDCSEAGIGVAIAEMCFAGNKGAEIFLKKVPLGEPIERNDAALFSESNSRVIVEVDSGRKEEFEKHMKGAVFSEIGNVSAGKLLVVNGLRGKILIQEPLENLKKAWKRTLDW